MKFLLFGTGDYYERYKKWIDKKDILALLDNSPKKQNTVIDGIRVLSPEEGVKLSADVIVILSFYVKEMRLQLLELGVPESVIYHFYDLHKLIYRKEIKKEIQYFGDAEEIIMSNNETEKKVLLLSQDLTLGGPSIALLHAAEILVAQGVKVVYASMIDGPLRTRLLSNNIPVIVDVNLQIETMNEADWTSNFSLIFCSTINFYVFLSERDVNIPAIWWLHDSAFFYDGVDRNVLQGISRTNLKIFSVGPVPKKAIQKYIPDISVERLLYGVMDTAGHTKRLQYKYEKVCFVTIGYVESRKGQDILVQAIRALPDETREKAIFYLVGQDSSMMAQQLREETQYMPELVMTGTVGREEINEILSVADVLICPSREDPMPTVATEAMMHGVVCVVSDAAGTAEYIQDGVDGFVFRSEDIQELSAKIGWCIEHREELDKISICSREIYERCFSMKVLEKALLDVVNSMLDR